MIKKNKGIASFYSAVETRLQADLTLLLPCQLVISGWIPLPHQSPAVWAKSTPVAGSGSQQGALGDSPRRQNPSAVLRVSGGKGSSF